MRAKLANSQSVLEGLVTEDFDLIQNGAEKMVVMTKGAQWKVGAGEEYTADTVRFVDAARDLIQNAKTKNIDGATLSYLQLTMRCVECHKHVRSVKTAGDGRIPDAFRDVNVKQASWRNGESSAHASSVCR
jgi:cytochrome c556